MEHVMKKMKVEAHLVRLRKEVAEIDTEMAESTLSPVPRGDETFFIVNHEARKRRLLREMKQYEHTLEECRRSIEEASAEKVGRLAERFEKHDGLKAERIGGLR